MKNIPAKETKYYDHFRAFLEGAAANFSERPAVTTYSRGKESTHSFKELKDDAFAFGKALCAHNLQGKHIAIVGENSYEWLTAYMGIAAAGGVCVCIDIEHADETIAEMIKEADAEAIVTSKSLENLCKAVKDQDERIQSLIVIGSAGEDGFNAFVRSAAGDEAASKAFEGVEINPKQTASIVFTSGTTSMAKPVMLSHRSTLWNAADSLTILSSGERVFNALLLYHTYGLTCAVVCPLIRGLHVGLTCDLKRMLQELSAFVPHTIVAVPLIIEQLHKLAWSLIIKAEKKEKVVRLMKLETVLRRTHTLLKKEVAEAFRGSCLENLSVILSGGAHLPLTEARHLLHMGITVLQGYGITECAPSISCNRNEDFDLSSVGLILPHYEVKIKDGEILVRGEPLMNGYYKNPALTEESFDGDWFKTGDLGIVDKRGHLFITGRKKNLIVMKNGKKVSAEEMEEEIRKMPLVKDVVAYGAKSGASADDVKIAISVYPDPKLSEQMTSYEILEQVQGFVDQLNQRLPTYKQIQMVNIRETDFDRTSAHKIKRQSI